MHISSAEDRYLGFLAYLKEHSLSEKDIQVLECNGTRMDSYHVTRDWLQRHPDPNNLGATAIFCFSDYMAYGVYTAVSQHGLHIPEDISVIGYDNNEYSDMTLPSLTTVDILPYQIGNRAARMMFELIHTAPANDVYLETVIPPTLILRHSTARPSHSPHGTQQ